MQSAATCTVSDAAVHASGIVTAVSLAPPRFTAAPKEAPLAMVAWVSSWIGCGVTATAAPRVMARTRAAIKSTATVAM
jgi:hypothetical protein